MLIKKPQLFPAGRVVMTVGAGDLLERRAASLEGLSSKALVLYYLTCHVRGEWSSMSETDRLLNRASVYCGDRVMSSHMVLGQEKLYLITEADRSSTTLLLPSEY